jgi:alpha-tubulin suppressor-like RCC1 family protein
VKLKLSNLRLFSSILGVGLLLVFFQNCSPSFRVNNVEDLASSGLGSDPGTPISADLGVTGVPILGFNKVFSQGMEGYCDVGLSGEVRCFNFPFSNPTIRSNIEFKVVSGLPPIKKMSWNCFLSQMNEVFCHGNNYSGEAGIDPSVAVSVSVPNKIIFNNAVQDIAKNCALLQMGKVYCWGNITGGLGSGFTYPIKSHLPQEIPGLPAIKRIVSVSYGGSYCAIDSSGGIWCWGGSLGVAATKVAQNSKAIDIAVFTSDAVNLCLHLEDGKVECGQQKDSSSGLYILSQMTDLDGIVEIKSAGQSICARNNKQQVACWGRNMFGRLGFVRKHWDGVLTPQFIKEWEGAQSLALNEFETCAVMSDTSLKCIGNSVGGFDSTSRVLGSSSLGLSKVANRFAVGPGGLCAVYGENKNICWDSINNAMDFTLPGQAVIRSGNDWVSVGVSTPVNNFSKLSGNCWIDETSKEVYCYGDNSYGQLGNGNLISSVTAVKVLGLSNVDQVEIDMSYMKTLCARSSIGRVSCWGMPLPFFSELTNWDPAVVRLSTALEVSGVNDAKEIQFFRQDLLVLKNDNTVIALSNSSGIQEALVGITNVKTIRYLKGSSQCLILTNDNLLCGRYDTDTGKIIGFDHVQGMVVGAELVSSQFGAQCSIQTNGSVVCSGSNEFGHLGQGDKSVYSTAVIVKNVQNAKQLFSFGYKMCALIEEDGSNGSQIKCWGPKNANNSKIEEPMVVADLAGYSPILNHLDQAVAFINKQNDMKIFLRLRVSAVPITLRRWVD